MKIKTLSTLAQVTAAALVLSFLVLSFAASAQAGMIIALFAAGLLGLGFARHRKV